MRAAAFSLRELIRKNTLDKNNKCDFDLTDNEKKLEQNPIRTAATKYANS